MYNNIIGVIKMVMSMTGYGIDTFHLEETTITVEIRSVNSRYLDFIPKIPRSLHELEMDIKNIIQANFVRGRIEVYISITGDYLTNKTLQVDYHLINQYINQMKIVQNKYGLVGDLPLTALTSNEDLFSIEETKTSSDSIKQLLLHSVEKAAKQVLVNRESEGAFLIKDIIKRIKSIESMVKSVEERQENVYVHYRNRIKERIEKHVGDSIAVDQAQLLQEIALLAEKGDIVEEITRILSHIHHFRQVIQHENPIGRKLDFITQELHREVNTIGSKSVDSKISEWVVSMKSEIEKIKEQLQNIE